MMKSLSTMFCLPLFCLASALAAGGCAGEAPARPSAAPPINCSLEIQTALVSGVELKSGTPLDAGDWKILSTCILPIESDGGPGNVVCNSNGTVIRIRWNAVQLRKTGEVVLDDFAWILENPIQWDHGATRLGWQADAGPQQLRKRYFGTDYLIMQTLTLDRTGLEKKPKRFVIRGRLLQQSPPVQPLKFPEAALQAK